MYEEPNNQIRSFIVLDQEQAFYRQELVGIEDIKDLIASSFGLMVCSVQLKGFVCDLDW